MSAPSISLLSCFSNIIGFRGVCDDVDSTSGLYANDLDINKDFVDQIITRQFSGALDFHQRKLAFAIKEVVDQTLNFMSKDFRVNTLLQNIRLGKMQDDLSLIAGDGNYKGINIDLNNSESYLNLFVNEIALQISTSQIVNVFIYDLIQDKLLKTVPVTCVANEISRAYPQFTIKSDRQKLNLLFCYDSSGISANTTYLRTGGSCSTCNGNSNGISNPYENVQSVKIDGSAQKIKSNLKNIGETGGLSVVHSLSCNHESWICSFSNMLAMPILYRYGIIVMEYAQSISPNDRQNTTVNINADEIKARLEVYKERYNESMNNAMSGLKVPDDKECFTCRSAMHHISMAM
ncbi:MAG: hypothetical protein ACEQSL_07700 [Sediminibacterium sp.]